MIHISKCKNNNGFTLVELLTVIAILALAVTIVIYTATGLIDSAKEKKLYNYR